VSRNTKRTCLASRIALSNHDPLPLTFSNIYDPLSKSLNSVSIVDVAFSTQDATNMASYCYHLSTIFAGIAFSNTDGSGSNDCPIYDSVLILFLLLFVTHC
jgi:hypothetical protein